MSIYQSKENPKYSGFENLEIMDAAKKYNKFIQQNILDAAPKNRHFTAYDFGAGTGQFTKIWQNEKKRLVDVAAIELDDDFKKVLTEKNIKVVNFDDIRPMSADFIYSVNVLEHIYDDVACLRQLHEKLKFGGKIYLYVPAFQFLWTQMDSNVGHVRRYNKADLKRKLESTSFQIESIEYADSAGFFASLALRHLTKDIGVLDRRKIIFFDQVLFPIGRVFDKFLFKRILGKNISVTAIKSKEGL